MNRIVLDSSAVLAVVNEEDGADVVRPVLAHAVISAVNVAEVYTKLNEYSADTASTGRELLRFVEVLPFTAQQARVTGDLRILTRKAGLSLGDRACISLALELNGEIYTSDSVWAELGLKCAIRPIRKPHKSVQ